MSNIRYYLRIMKKSYNKSNVFRKQDVELDVKQSDVGRGVAVDNGSPTASYTTCRPNDVDDIAEQSNDVDDGAERVVDEFDKSAECFDIGREVGVELSDDQVEAAGGVDEKCELVDGVMSPGHVPLKQSSPVEKKRKGRIPLVETKWIWECAVSVRKLGKRCGYSKKVYEMFLSRDE